MLRTTQDNPQRLGHLFFKRTSLENPEVETQ